MTNKYLEYQDFANIKKKNLTITTNAELQSSSSLENLKSSASSIKYASFEKDFYDTNNPFKLAKAGDKLGLISKSVSDEYGRIDVIIEITANKAFSVPGITLGSIGKLSKLSITYYDESENLIRNEPFTDEQIDNEVFFFNVANESVKKIVINIAQIENPNHFLKLYKLDLGSVRILDNSNLVDISVNNHYSLDGSTIEYSVLNLTLFHTDDVEYLFRKKQPITIKDVDGKIYDKFFAVSSENKNNNIINVKAYDYVSQLDKKFHGGIYGKFDIPAYSYNSLIDEIFEGTDIEYSTVGTDDIKVKGYIPITTKRKALQMLCRGTNTRCYKIDGKLHFKAIQDCNKVTYLESNISKDFSVEKQKKIAKLTLRKHNYKKSKEKVELFNGFLDESTPQNPSMQLIEFDEPAWDVRAYEVTGENSDGDDILVSSTNVAFYTAPLGNGFDEDFTVCNHCVVKYADTTRRVVIMGRKIKDIVRNFYTVKLNNVRISDENLYDDVVIEDITISNNLKLTAKRLFGIYQSQSIQKFDVVDKETPLIGDYAYTPFIPTSKKIEIIDSDDEISTLTVNPKITSITDDFSGLYELEVEI